MGLLREEIQRQVDFIGNVEELDLLKMEDGLTMQFTNAAGTKVVVTAVEWNAVIEAAKQWWDSR